MLGRPWGSSWKNNWDFDLLISIVFSANSGILNSRVHEIDTFASISRPGSKLAGKKLEFFLASKSDGKSST
jgi:hypothetical protein